jgi:hypothetical protein
MQIWCSWQTFSSKLTASTSRFSGLSTFPRVTQPYKKPDLVTFLPYVSLIFNRLRRVLSRQMKSVDLPAKEISSFLHQSRMICNWRLREYTALPVTVVRSAFGIHQVKGAPMTFPSRTCSINLRYCTQLHYTSNLSMKLRYVHMRVSAFPTLWTGRMASVWASHGNLSSAP